MQTVILLRKKQNQYSKDKVKFKLYAGLACIVRHRDYSGRDGDLLHHGFFCLVIWK